MNNKKILSFVLATNMLFAASCNKSNDKKNSNNEHRHYYVTMGNRTIIFKDCDDSTRDVSIEVSKIYSDYASGVYGWVYDRDKNLLFVSDDITIRSIKNEKEEEYASIFESGLIESNHAEYFNSEHYNVPKLTK